MILGVRKADSAVENQLERCFCRLQGLAVVVSGQKWSCSLSGLECGDADATERLLPHTH